MTEQNRPEMKVEHIVAAPVDRVFEVWTSPKHLDQWWGPNGFKTTTSSMTFEVGGAWDYKMDHAEYGKFPNYIRYIEIEKNKKIVYDHGTTKNAQPEFTSTVTFEDLGNLTTKVTLHLRFNTQSYFNVAKKHGAESGGMQTLQKLEKYVKSRM